MRTDLQDSFVLFYNVSFFNYDYFTVFALLKIFVFIPVIYCQMLLTLITFMNKVFLIIFVSSCMSSDTSVTGRSGYSANGNLFVRSAPLRL